MPALAFGPGLNVEGALLRACDGPVQSTQQLAGHTAAKLAAAQSQGQGQVVDGKEEAKETLEVRVQASSVAVKRVAFDTITNNTGLL